MLIKLLKTIVIIFLFFFQNSLYSKNKDSNYLSSKNLAEYLSAITSYDNGENTKSLEFFDKSKLLIDEHNPYLKKYIFSLITEGKINKAIKVLKSNLNKENSNFFESYLLLTIDSIKNKDFEKSNIYLEKLSNFTSDNKFNLLIFESLKKYNYLFQNKKILNEKSSFNNLLYISKAFENCYIGKQNESISAFQNLINNSDIDYTRYIFFYINYLSQEKKFKKAKEVAFEIEDLNSSLLTFQTKTLVNKGKFKKINKIFSCQEELDVLSEFFFLVSNLYSGQQNFNKSNFYLNISYFLNPKFKFNLSLMVENYYLDGKYSKSKKVLSNYDINDGIYHWYKIKKNTDIMSKEKNLNSSFIYLNSNFSNIKKPSTKIIFDMANLAKNFKKYEIAINYYNKVLKDIDPKSQIYADVLYRRGASYERIKEFEKSDIDLIESLKIDPDNAYVLNYLAYSWLERNYKINEAIKMLERAYEIKSNDPFILDSVGWAYYLTNDFKKAEEFLRSAIQLMPEDPVVNDHYADILWRLNRKIEANYYWQSVLKFKDTEEKMKKDINNKILKGPNNT